MLNSIGEVLPHAARRFCDKTALIVEQRNFSFRDLDGLSSAFASSLVKLGLKPGDRATLYAPNSWEWIVSYYGVLKTGAVINPVNVMLTPAEVAYVAKDCGAKVLIGSQEKIAPALAVGVTGLTTIVFGDTSVPGTAAFNELVAEPAAFEPVPVDPKALSTIGYTSGTTGHPKGRHAVASRGHSQRRHDRSNARKVESRHGRDGAALSACLRQCRFQRRHALWAYTRPAPTLRCGRDAGKHPDALGNDV
jgi:acyl-CoA synthetase (AMP-forming)/AMP-acid ligase II